MKTGILTFHWAHNYGAVLQAYALQTFLQRQGHQVEIIDYRPDWAQDNKKRPIPTSPGALLSNLNHAQRRSRFRRFCREHLNLSARSYRYGETICGYDAVIVGSDQVFNPDIIASGGRLDDTYLLANIAEGTHKIAYAASFGNSSLPASYAEVFRDRLKDFDAIGIREESGVQIVRDLGMDACSVPDPTILLGDFSALASARRTETQDYILSFIFQQTESTLAVRRAVSQSVGAEIRNFVNLNQRVRGVRGILNPTPQEWIRLIRDARYVVTDSFHSTVFCILNHRPFISLSLNGWGADWCERIKALLSGAGLSHRLLAQPTEENVKTLCEETVDWPSVDEKLSAWRKNGELFLNRIVRP